MIGWQDRIEDAPERLHQSIALIPHDDGDQWWCGWNDTHSWFEMPIAQAQPERSLRDGIRASVLEELGLTPADVLVANMAQRHLEFSGPLPDVGREVDVAVAFYLVHLYGARARAHVDRLVQGRWLARTELLNGQTRDGWAVHPRLCYLLQRADVLPYAC